MRWTSSPSASAGKRVARTGKHARASTHAGRILLFLSALEVSIVLILVEIYKAPVYDMTLLTTNAVAGAIALIASSWLLARQIQLSGELRRRAIALGAATNLITCLVAFLLSEAVVRGVARRSPEGIEVGAVRLTPSWSEVVAHSRHVMTSATPWGTWDASYFVYDSDLGWTVGPNRRSPDGLYFSSVEGIRSAGPDVRMADVMPRARVALIGDSNAFSFEVRFEESWGYHLQRLLGDDVQVLNLGVDGYGIDQMYLRYKRDVRPWKPRVVVIGFIEHDLRRTMAVYPFISLGWPGYLVKPRFVLENGELKLLNVPLPTPDEILGTKRIQELPYFEYDSVLSGTKLAWWYEYRPLVLRLVTSVFPRRRSEGQRSEEAIIALNSQLLARLVTSIEQDGAVAMLVLLHDLEGKTVMARETLARVGVPLLDVTTCLSTVPADRRMVPSGHHFTAIANLAIARCTAPAVELALR